jgi:hypothetical protein
VQTYVALLRGINVAGRRTVGMADLRDLFARLGHVDVQTYVQSGNVLFRSDEDPADIVAAVEHGIAGRRRSCEGSSSTTRSWSTGPIPRRSTPRCWPGRPTGRASAR